MKLQRIKGKLILASLSFTALGSAVGQVSEKGLSPASNTYNAYNSASIARDSGLSQPLNLLNDFYPAIEVSVADHSNVRRRPDFEEDDLKIIAKPSLAYRSNLGRHQFYAAYNGTYTFHQDLTQEDVESNALNAKLGLDLSRRWDIDVFGGIGEGFEQRGISGSREFSSFTNNGIDSGPERIESLNYGADLIFGRKTGIITAVLGYEYSESGFSSDDLSNILTSESRDRETESVHFDLNWRFASKTSVFGRVERRETNYDSFNSDIDSDQADFLVGVRFSPASTLNGVLAVGRSDKDFKNSNREGYDDNAYYVNLNYNISPFSVIELSASRVVEEPSDQLSSFYESEFIGVGWNHSLTSKFSLDVFAKFIDDDYDIDRQDQFTDWGIGIDYAWRSWLTAGIYYGEIERESTIDDIAYEDTYFGLRLRSDLRSLLKGRGKKRPEPSSFGKPKKTTKAQ